MALTRGSYIGLLNGCLLALVFASRAAATGDLLAYLAQQNGIWQVWVASPDGSGARQISRSGDDKARVSWYPDGKHLLANTLEGRLVHLDVEAGDEESVSSPMGGIFDAVLSPDGKTIAFSASTSDSRDANDIWIVNASGTDPKRLVSMPHLQHWPAWSRDGRWIYFLSTDGGERQEIWRVSADGASREQVSVGGLHHFDAAPGPDGRIAYSSNRSGNYEIWIQSGSDTPRQVTDDPAVDSGPTWNADGTALIFESGRGGAINLWRLELREGAPSTLRQITKHEGGARGAAWWHPPASR